MDYRPFQNSDPPRIVALWNGCRLGRGAAQGVTPDAFEHCVFSKPYFNPRGCLVAVENGRIVGFVLAGFAPQEQRAALNPETGVISAVVVHGEFQRRGIGRELVRRAEAYLAGNGALTVIAGPAGADAPFLVGLYGGVQPAGFLDSDPGAEPFFTALGYQPQRRQAVLQRDLETGSDPVNVQLMTIRRKSQLAVSQNPVKETWWWNARFGAQDTLRFFLVPKNDKSPQAAVTVVNLELFLPKWRQQAVGLIDLAVGPEERKQGYAQALLVDVCRRLRDERFTLAEMQTAEDDAAMLAILQAAGFQPVDAGTVFHKPLAG